MDAFHSFWSLPGYLRSGGHIDFPEFELLTAMLSALKWREKNGSIRLITDTPGAMFFRRLGMEELWDEIDLSLDEPDPQIDPYFFWAAGKLLALRKMDTPCVMLDTDLIVWETLDHLTDYDLAAAHAEKLNPVVYPDPQTFAFHGEYQFPDPWDFNLDAVNTAFLYIKNAEFRDHYVEAALDFCRHVNTERLTPVSAMCFAEQRVLPMCAKEKDQSLVYLLDLFRAEEQQILTHTWGYKNILRQDEREREAFGKKCVGRILRDFPEREKMLEQNMLLKKYLKML